jgi:AbrB family looped-hinge helix DNA binding protein
MMTATVDKSGRVTIPRALRDRMGINPATVLEFRVKTGVLMAVKAGLEDTVSAATGCLKTGRSSDDWMAELRGAV